MTVRTSVITLILQNDEIVAVPLRDGLRVQVLSDVMGLRTCQRYQNAAFIKDSAMLVLWADSPQEIIRRTFDIQAQMMENFSHGMSPYDEKSPAKESQAVLISEKPLEGPNYDEEDAGILREDGPRRIVLNQAVLTAMTLILIIAALGSGWRQMAVEIVVDQSYLRLAILVVVPLQIWLALVGNMQDLSTEDLLMNHHFLVLHANCGRLRSTANWANEPNGQKYQILFWSCTSKDITQRIASCHHSMSCLQGRSLLCHRSNNEIIAGCNRDV